MLDYTADAEKLGKNLGDDLAEGKPTLPLIHAMATGTKEQADFIKKTIKEGNRTAHMDILSIIKSTGSLAYTAEFADKEAQKAIDALRDIADNDYKLAMEQLALFSIQRSH